jgi:ubiquinone biosynthesis protein COQ9
MESSQQKILDYCLKNSSFDGWNEKLLKNASLSAGLDAHYHKILFPAGVADILLFFAEETNRQMAESAVLPANGVTAKIKAAVLYRLQLNQPHKAAIKAALKFYATNPLAALKATYSAVDAIWRLIGDTSTDFNFYTKRTLLAGVYSATIYYWLDDTSEEGTKTAEFLDKRLAEVGQFNKFMSKAKGLFANI